jgi:transcriptional regulator of heat shock response
VEKLKLDLSSATVRHTMRELEEAGYIFQPHPSAGRVPTDKGYRYFVDSLMEEKELGREDQRSLQTQLLKLKAENNRLARTVAKMLSVMSQNVALSGLVDSDSVWDFGMSKLLAEPEFKETDHVCQVATLLEYIDENIKNLAEKLSTGAAQPEVDIFIGKENPLGKAEHCSMIVAGIEFPSGEKGIIALVGPKRMHYDKNVSLIKYVRKLLSAGALIIILSNVL